MVEFEKGNRPAVPTIFDLQGKRVWVAGHRGMVGSAIVRRLAAENCELITVDRQSLDLTRQSDVEAWISRNRPQVIFLAAAKVGGIRANASYPASFLAENLAIQSNIIAAASNNAVEKLLFLGSSCIYPKFAPQPIEEQALLTGSLEPTNEWYAVAKISGIKLCQAYRRQFGADYISAMPTNLYGPGDNFNLDSSHVIPALLRKAHEAKSANQKSMTIWGSGTPRREFLHVDDCAAACVHLMKVYSGEEHVNVGSGEDLTTLDLAQMIRDVVGFDGRIDHDLSKPDGTPRKLLSIERLQELGWSPAISLRSGLEETYKHFLAHHLDDEFRR